jgi:hypothetical protein
MIPPWLASLIAQTPSRLPKPRKGPRRLLICLADHYEPRRGKGAAMAGRGEEIVRRWVEEYPRLFGEFRDSDGYHPRHSFFIPIEEYDPGEIDLLGRLCRKGFGEVEIHLHHGDDNAENLRRTFDEAVANLSGRHGQLAQRRSNGATAFGFIHGNWALDNGRLEDRFCGVNNELDILLDCGCYADFTMPSAPAGGQTRMMNQIYWAVDDPEHPKSHDRGTPLGRGARPDRSLLMIQGPLVLDWSRPKALVFPRLENGCVQGSQPLSASRVPHWLRARVQVRNRPDWYFAKLHTHGADDRNIDSLLGEPSVRFHRALAEMAASDPDFTFHYVTAREMANLALAAADGWTGSVAEARDYALVWNGGGG